MAKDWIGFDWEEHELLIKDLNEVLVFWWRATAKESYFSGAKILENLYWEVPKRMMKWKWYFEYRTALLQVKYPKAYIESAWGQREPEQSLEVLKQIRLKHKISAKKRKITEWKNKIKTYKDEWTSLFPIEEDPQYIQAMNKVKEKEDELNNLVITN